MRLIDADVLIADLEYDVEIDTRELNDLDDESRRDIVQFDKDCKENAIDLLRNAPTAYPEAEWVPISERSPGIHGEYLVQDVNGYIY